ncbi:hypothetical protein PAL_GLEAN10005369 [Pteropus alecto]|uniref:Uncharacterized protein n=1 Tax=Pteropus alecto TaxID=9402 RepID=L5JTU6_PTEAL|nr:hypothetical protein PAL_GLEAN10005369 [Pteropus alecto]
MHPPNLGHHPLDPALSQPEARAWGSVRSSGSPPEAIQTGPPSAAASALEGPPVRHWGAVGHGRQCDLVQDAGAAFGACLTPPPSALPSQRRPEDGSERRGTLRGCPVCHGLGTLTKRAFLIKINAT